MPAAPNTLQTTSKICAWFLCACRGYRVQFRCCIPRMSLFGGIMYQHIWVLAPASAAIVHFHSTAA